MKLTCSKFHAHSNQFFNLSNKNKYICLITELISDTLNFICDENSHKFSRFIHPFFCDLLRKQGFNRLLTLRTNHKMNFSIQITNNAIAYFEI